MNKTNEQNKRAFNSGLILRIRDFSFYIWEHTRNGFRLMVGHREGKIMRGLFALRSGWSKYKDAEGKEMNFRLFHVFGLWIEIRIG